MAVALFPYLQYKFFYVIEKQNSTDNWRQQGYW